MGNGSASSSERVRQLTRGQRQEWWGTASSAWHEVNKLKLSQLIKSSSRMCSGAARRVNQSGTRNPTSADPDPALKGGFCGIWSKERVSSWWQLCIFQGLCGRQEAARRKISQILRADWCKQSTHLFLFHLFLILAAVKTVIKVCDVLMIPVFWATPPSDPFPC